jgi:hypothetical protein
MPLRRLQKYLRHFSFLFTVFVALSSAYAKDISVFDIRRPLSMENGQELPKDYYINGGSETGLKVGMLVTITRRLTLYDPFQNKSPGDLLVPVGRLRIIQVQEGLSVARLEDMMERVQLPNLDIDAVTIGDRLDLTTAKMAPKKTAENETPAPMVPQVEVLAVPAVQSTESSSHSPNISLPTQGPTL